MKSSAFFHLQKIIFFILLLTELGAQTVRNEAILSYNRGVQAFAQNRVLDSIRHFQQAIEINQNYSDAYRETARSFYYLGESDEAERYIMQALQLAPQDTRNLNLYGRILITQGRTDEAEAIFTNILSDERFNNDARIGLGELSTAQGNIIQALEYYQNSLELLPQDHRILLSLAFIYRDQGRISLAEDYIISAVQSNSQNPWLHFYAADFYMLIGDASEAENYARTSLTLQPGFIPALEILGRIYVQLGEYEIAMSILQQLDMNVLADDELMLFTRAVAEYNSNNVDAAMRSLGSLLRDNPDNEVARLFLEDILLYERDFDDPQRAIHAAFHFTRADEYAQRNQNDSALYHYHRGLTLAPFSVEGRRSYARFFRETSEYARYLNQLEFLRDQLQTSDIELTDDLEIYTDFLRNSVAQTWNVNQFISKRNSFRMALFIQEDGKILHSGVENLIAGHVMNQLYSSSRIEFIVPSGIDALNYEPIRIDTNAEAFAAARSGDSDYYIFLEVNESKETIELHATLHLGRTGRQLQTFRVIRSGNTRIKDAVLQLSAALLQALPLHGTILQRKFETALINLGHNDGLEEGQELLVIKPADLSLHNETPSFAYNSEDIVGTAVLNNVDLFISQVELTPEGFFDRIHIGDTVFIMSTEEADGMDPQTESSNELYERIRTIR